MVRGRARSAVADDRHRLHDGLEALGGLLLIVAYIWLFRGRGPAVSAIVIALIGSHVWHGETPASLGLGWKSARAVVPALGAVAALLAVSLLISPTAQLPYAMRGRTVFGMHVPPDASVGAAASAVFLFYLPWGTVQQYALNGFFINRLTSAFSGVRAGRSLAACAAALCFGAAHLPNLSLAMPSVAIGLLSALAWQRYRNIYALGLAHAIIGTVVIMTALWSMPNGLRTGTDVRAAPAVRADLQH